MAQRPAKPRAAASPGPPAQGQVAKTTSAGFVYVLGSRAGSGWRTYVGWTVDLDRRLVQHNDGSGAKSTRGRKWVLLYAERYDKSEQAMSREWYLKRDRRFRKALSGG